MARPMHRRHDVGAGTARLAFVCAAAVTAASLGGLLLPGAYARETPSLAAQCIGQDWVNLMVAVPWLVVTAAFAARGSARARALLGGGFAYVAYSYAIYAFGIHFNRLFLLYCAGLGLSVFGLVRTLASGLPHGDPAPRRFAGWTQIGIAAVFAVLWLSEIVPALARGEAPRSVAEEKLLTNPVHVLDLSLALPALALSGISLLRRRPLGFLLTPVLLSFALLMAVAIGGMVVAVWIRGIETNATVAAVFAALAALCGAALVAPLRAMPSR